MGLFSSKEQKYAGTLKWEEIKNDGPPRNSWRAKVPGGWLFILWWGAAYDGSGITFIPDPEHKWDGNSL